MPKANAKSSSTSPDSSGKAKGKGRPSPICFRCGKKGHLSVNCTNEPLAKKRQITDAASVIFDMTPWANDFAEWRAQQEYARQQPSSLSENVNTLEETRGCAVLDSGATVMCSSTIAAEEVQMQRLRQNEPGSPSLRDSDRCFRFADGGTNEAQKMVEQPITSGLLQGKTINMHLIDRAGNETSPLFSIDDQRRSRMVVDFEENKVMFKDKPDEWHTLPVTRKGLMMIPLTKEACERHMKPQSAEPPPPPSPPTKDTRRRKLMKKVARKAIAQFSPARACCVEEE